MPWNREEMAARAASELKVFLLSIPKQVLVP